ncbi:MAG: winged helix-turn-helix domain-containing protein [Candidatus Aenigmatarchaeota archaeon]
MKVLPRLSEMSPLQAVYGNSTRELIVGHLLGTKDGTDFFSRIKEKLALQNGSASYHLRALEKMGVLTSYPKDNRKWYRLKKSGGPEDIEGDILSVVNKHEDGLCVGEVARFVLARYGTVANRLQKLSENGDIVYDRHDRRYYPATRHDS